MRLLIVSCVAVFLFSGCAKVDVLTKTGDLQRLTGLKTYSWLITDKAVSKNVRVANPVVTAAVRSAVEKNLKQKGYTKVEGEAPNFVVTWFGAIEQKVRVDSINHFYSSYGYGSVAQQLEVISPVAGTRREYEEGTILIDLLDPQEHQVLWRGVGSRRLRAGMDTTEATLFIDKMVREIFVKFPVVD